jgi:hypothetical protein
MPLMFAGLADECAQRGRWLRDGFLRRPLRKIYDRAARAIGLSREPIT